MEREAPLTGISDNSVMRIIMNPRMSFIQTGLQFKSSCDSVLTEKPITGHKTVFIISSQTGVNEQAMELIM